MFSSGIIHIPHSSEIIPDSFGDIDDPKLLYYIDLQTDLYTDFLFHYPDTKNVKTIKFDYSRFFCDVERYWCDEKEVKSVCGQGVYYKKFIDGSDINRIDTKSDIKEFYDYHHERIKLNSNFLLKKYNNCLILDCHSFNDEFFDKAPDICIGVNKKFKGLNKIINHFKKSGYSVGVNYPYNGSIYPLDYYNKNLNSVMIDINKRIYLYGDSDFNKIKMVINNLFMKIFK